MKSILAAASLCLLCGPGLAQSLVPGPAAASRYEMQPIEGGVARLDTVTGEVSLCRIEAEVLRCRPSEESDAPAAMPLAPGVPRTSPDVASPADEDAELDKAIDRMKRFFRAFRDISREFEEEGGEPKAPDGPTPERT